MKLNRIIFLAALFATQAFGQAVIDDSFGAQGTAGAGFFQAANQSSAPSTPTSAGRIYFDSSNRLSWKGTNGFSRTFDGTANTASRIYVLPDIAGTVALTSTTLVSGRVPFVTTGGLLTDASTLTFSAGTLTATNYVGTFAGNTFTTGTGTLTIAASKTLTASDNVTLASDGTGTRTLNISAGGTLGTSAFVTLGTGVGTALAIATNAAGGFSPIDGTATLTNKTISGASNTITNVSLTTGVTGTLPVANGGTGVTTSTGSGSTVLSASPGLTGTPTAPTAAASTNTTQIATTAFVLANAGASVANATGTINSAAGTVTTGSATTAMKSDSAPALPATMTGVNSITSATNTTLTLATLDNNKAIAITPQGTGPITIPQSTKFGRSAAATEYISFENSRIDIIAGGQTYSISSGAFYPEIGTTQDLGKTGTLESWRNINLVGVMNQYKGVQTVAWGVPAIYGTGRSTAQTAAVASVATYTCGSADGTFLISANVNVTTSSAESFSVSCDYTDETNTARNVVFPFVLLAGTFSNSIAFANGAVPYEGAQLRIRCKASTSITIKTTGTFTGCTYNVEGDITQVK